MKTGQCCKALLGSCRGAAAIILALVLTALLAFIAFAIDIGYVAVTKNELQNIADAAALAGVRTLGRLYECDGDLAGCPGAMSAEDQWSYAADIATIRQAIYDVASQNSAGGKGGIVIRADDIVIGEWDAVDREIDPVTNIGPDAVKVTARRDASANSPITTFFAGIMGIDTADVSADATAALTGESIAGPGDLPIPVAINKSWMSTLPCEEDLTLYPASDEKCAAWHVYDAADYRQHSASQMEQLIQDLAAGTFSSPETIAGETVYYADNGVAAKLFKEETMPHLFDTMRVLNDGILDRDDDPATWTTAVAVYDDLGDTSCNPSGPVLIVGFAAVTITDVVTTPEKYIEATVVCDLVESGRGGGGYYGTRGSIPGLVE